MKRSIRHYLIIVLAFASCRAYDCSKADGFLELIGFTNQEADSILLKRYKRDTNFQTLVDSILITSTNTDIYTYGDTTSFVGGGMELRIVSDYDYELYFEKIDKRFTITKITEQQNSRNWDLSCKKTQCVNSLINYRLNDQYSDVQRNTIDVRK